MSTTSIASSEVSTTSLSRLYRTAGIGAIVAGVAYILQPVFVFLLAPDNDGSTVALLEAGRWSAPYEVVVFSAIGVGTLFLVVSFHRLLLARGGSTVGAAVASIFGILSAVGWFGAAAGLIQTHGLGLQNMTAIITDPTLQSVWIQGQSFAAEVLWFVLIGATGWFVGVATAGRRAGLVGMPLAILAIIAALAIAVPSVVFLVPFGVLTLIPVFIILGIAFLLKSRANA